MQTQTQTQPKTKLSKAGHPKGGRPIGSKAKIPAGFVGPGELSKLLPFLGTEAAIRGACSQNPTSLPPRVLRPGKKKQPLLWHVATALAWAEVVFGKHVVAGLAYPAATEPAVAAPASSVWNFADQISTSSPGDTADKAKRKPGRPRNKAKA
ncbi:hypothetical protein THIX_60795 [Thiomonas sp. X19]|uniref:hypothetical protein n=1 Tax=Thiomonas sp. X19 TaxID=1050370 RepID=UPI000B6B3691|nr:hypothetical protein [Thiomonas sp. X19]SCC94737.1 hypothetical protein THIX_60795 [Thiomonas sp. X19]